MIDLEFDPVAQRVTITLGGRQEPSLDGLYRAHVRRIDVQADALDLLLGNVQRERLFCARGRLLLLFAWKLASDMTHGADSRQQTADSSGSGQEPRAGAPGAGAPRAFRGDGVDVSFRGDGVGTKSQEPAPGGAS